MATEVTSIGVGMETDGVERGIRTLQQLANQGPRVEKSMQGIEAAASKADKSLNGIGAGSDRGLKAIAGSASGAEQGLSRVSKSAEETKRYIDNLHRSITGMGTIQTAPVARSFDSVKTSALDASKAVDLLKSTLAVTGIGIGVKEVISLADGYTKFTAQLKLASKSAEDYAASMTAVRRISLDAQQGLAETGTLYARIANGTAELGLSQQKLSDITETVALGLKVSGATASESASAMLQLSQAFASGVLRGEEFNAVNESAPRLMKALADGIGVPVGALRELASEGKITSQVMADALPKAMESIRKEAEQIQTIGGSFTILKNNLLEFVGAGDKASGATKAISTSITGLANNLDTIAVAAGGLALILAGRYVGAMTAASASTVAMAASTVRANVAAVALSASMSPAAAAVSAFGIAARGASTAVLGLFGGPWGLAITAIGAATAAFLYFRDTTEETIKSLGGLNQPLEDLKKKLDELPPEKRISIVMNIGNQQVKALEDSEATLERLKNSVAAFMHQRYPNEEVQAFKQKLDDAAQSGENMIPLLQDAAKSMAIRPEYLNQWIQLAANFRDAQAAAGDLKAKVDELGAKPFEVVGPTIAQRDAQAQRDAAEALKGAAAYKSKAEQMAEVRSQGDKLREALRNLTATNQGTSKSADDLRARIAGVDERLASMAKSGRSAAGGAKQVENAYSSLSKRVGDYIEQLRIEATQSDKASTAQRLQIQLDDLLVKSKGKVTAAKVESLKADIQTARAMEDEAKAVKRAVEAYQDYIRDQEAIARADVELSKAKEALWKSIADQNIELENQSRMLELEASNIGKSAYERTLANEVLKAQIELEKELRDISNNQTLDGGAKDEAEAAARARAVKKIALAERKAYVTEWEKTSQTIGDTLADYIMGGGKDAAQYLKRLFSTLVLQPIVQTTVGSIFGVSGGAQSVLGGGNGGVLGTASNLNSLYGAFSGGITSSIGGAIGSLGSMFGSSALTSFAAGIKGSTLAAGLAGPTTAGASGAMGLGASVGAALPWVAGGLAIASLFGGNLMGSLFGRKLKDSGIEGTFGGSQGFTGNTFEYYKGGLFRSNKTVRNPLEEATRSQFADQFTGAQSAIKTMGDTLGLITGAVDSATYSIKLSLKGLSEEDAAKAIQAEFDRIAESMAGLVLVTNEYSIADENRIETLTRLSSSLTAFNGSLELLGISAYEASLKSADAAYKIISAFGGLESYGQAIQGYYQNFYSEGERMLKQRELQMQALGDLGLYIDPASGDAAKELFRKTVEEAMASGQAELAAKLLAMSSAFSSTADYAQKLIGEISEASVKAAEDAAEAARELALKAAEAAASAISQSWSSLVTSSGWAAQFLGDTSGLQMQLGAVKSSYAGAETIQQREDALGKIISLEQSLWQADEENRRAAIEAVQAQAQAIREQLASVNALISASQKLSDYASSLTLGNVSGASEAERMRILQSQYSTLLSSANTGDIEAISKIQGVASDYIAIAKNLSSSEEDYSSVIAKIAAELGAVGAIQSASAKSQAAALEEEAKKKEKEASDLQKRQFDVSDETKKLIAKQLEDSASQFEIDLENTKKQLAQGELNIELLTGLPSELTGVLSATLVPAITSIADAAMAAASMAASSAEAARDAAASASAALSAYAASNSGSSSVSLPKFDVGANVITRDMAAIVHKGEAIIPKAFNPWAGGNASWMNIGASNTDSLLAQLIDDNRRQSGEIIRLNREVARLMNTWDLGGIPPTRQEAMA